MGARTDTVKAACLWSITARCVKIERRRLCPQATKPQTFMRLRVSRPPRGRREQWRRARIARRRFASGRSRCGGRRLHDERFARRQKAPGSLPTARLAADARADGARPPRKHCPRGRRSNQQQVVKRERERRPQAQPHTSALRWGEYQRSVKNCQEKNQRYLETSFCAHHHTKDY
jgi:hypothetical protein